MSGTYARGTSKRTMSTCMRRNTYYDLMPASCRDKRVCNRSWPLIAWRQLPCKAFLWIWSYARYRGKNGNIKSTIFPKYLLFSILFFFLRSSFPEFFFQRFLVVTWCESASNICYFVFAFTFHRRASSSSCNTK